jgi:hypothetical protein
MQGDFRYGRNDAQILGRCAKPFLPAHTVLNVRSDTADTAERDDARALSILFDLLHGTTEGRNVLGDQ